MKKTILVTGAHRSGSTWIGQILSSAPGVKYIHEPFNIKIERDNSPLKYWFEYLGPNTSKSHQELVIQYMNSFYKTELDATLKKWKLPEKLINFFTSPYKDRILFKDPIAILSSEWLYENLECDVLISIRHPAAFVASIKAKDWHYDFVHFLHQKELINTYFKNDIEIITEYTNNKKTIVEQAILLWNLIYSTVHLFREKHQNQWQFVRHEDISHNPTEEFKKIFKKLGLRYNKRVENEILSSTNPDIESEFKRNSLRNIKSWKEKLSESEIQLIKKDTKQVWEKFYSESDW